MGRDVGPAFQRRYRDTPSSNIGVRRVSCRVMHRRARARSGPTNDTDDTRELPESVVAESRWD
eukprot:gene16750-biopygen15846